MNAIEILKSLKEQVSPTKNDYKPELKISKTVQPDKRLGFNETFLNAHQELNDKVKR